MLDIGGKLDTIAQLLAGAPPAPEEKLLFQKYVYCKEDYTSWVESLLGDLGISYTQVGSLVNGLYEYRCECTNDQFNQVILKVELSTNPVLATYKKIDSFSDLIGVNVFDMDSFAAGCDSRISKSDTITADMIRYWLNVQNDWVVQRQLDMAGSASIGTYSIDFTGGNVISGSVPVNGSIRDNILYRKIISGSGFGYSLTNCTIEGWIVDYRQKNDGMNGASVVTGGNGENAFDDDLDTSTDNYSSKTVAWVTRWEVSLDAFDMGGLHAWFKITCTDTSRTQYLRLEVYTDAGGWETVYTKSLGGTASWVGGVHTSFPKTGVTKVRMQLYVPITAVYVYGQIFDISLTS